VHFLLPIAPVASDRVGVRQRAMSLKTSVLIRTGNQIASGSMAEHITVDCLQVSAKLPLPAPTPLAIAFFIRN
jgi:hypothetical protein